MFVLIDLGHPGEMSEHLMPEVYGPYETRRDAEEAAEMIDANGGVSSITRLNPPTDLE